MNKQEVIDKLKAAIPEPGRDGYKRVEEITLNYALELVEKLGKVTVPQFVADWYEENKYYFEYNLFSLCIDFHERKLQEDLYEWFNYLSNKPIETLVMMHKLGYAVDMEEVEECNQKH